MNVTIYDIQVMTFQIAPFDIEFSVTYKELDFSHLLVSFSETKALDIEISFLIYNTIHIYLIDK